MKTWKTVAVAALVVVAVAFVASTAFAQAYAPFGRYGSMAQGSGMMGGQGCRMYRPASGTVGNQSSGTYQSSNSSLQQHCGLCNGWCCP